MSASFSELANVRVGEVERPKPLPNGHYQAMFTGPFKEHKAQSGNIALRFPFKLVAATEDVDADALATAGGIPDKEYAIDFWMSPDARYRFTEFVKAMDISEELTLVEAAEALVGSNRPFLIEARQEAGQRDPEAIYTRFDNPAAVD